MFGVVRPGGTETFAKCLVRIARIRFKADFYAAINFAKSTRYSILDSGRLMPGLLVAGSRGQIYQFYIYTAFQIYVPD